MSEPVITVDNSIPDTHILTIENNGIHMRLTVSGITLTEVGTQFLEDSLSDMSGALKALLHFPKLGIARKRVRDAQS